MTRQHLLDIFIVTWVFSVA